MCNPFALVLYSHLVDLTFCFYFSSVCVDISQSVWWLFPILSFDRSVLYYIIILMHTSKCIPFPQKNFFFRYLLNYTNKLLMIITLWINVYLMKDMNILRYISIFIFGCLDMTIYYVFKGANFSSICILTLHSIK